MWIARQKGDLAVSYSGGNQIRIPITGIGYIAGDVNTWAQFNPNQDATCYLNANAVAGGQLPLPCANSEITGGIWSCQSWYYNNGLGYPNWQVQRILLLFTYNNNITVNPLTLFVRMLQVQQQSKNSIQNQTGTGILQSSIFASGRASFRWVIETSDPNFSYSADLRIKAIRQTTSFFNNSV